MISTVKSVKPTGKEPYQSANGLLYSFYYEFADGHKLCANHKTETPRFNVGDQVDYSITSTNKHGSLGKVDRPKDGAPIPTQQPLQPNTKFSTGETQLDRIERKLDEVLANQNPPF